MSIYIGNNGTEKVLHLYNDQAAIATNGSSTSFHSSMPYMKVINIHRFTQNGTVPYSEAGGFTTVGYSSSTAVPVNSNCLVVGYDAGTRYFFQAQIDSPDWYALPDVATFGNIGSTGLCFGLVNTTTGFCGSEIDLPSKLYFEYIDVYEVSEIITTSATDIRIDSSGLYINGTNVLGSNNKYLAFIDNLEGRVNDYDTILAIPYSNDTNPNSTAGGNFVTSTSNLSYVNQRPNGGHTLVQLINSYPFPLTSVALDSAAGKGSIGCVKNGISFPLFSANTHLFTATQTVVDHLAIPINTTIGSGVTLVSTLYIPLVVGQTLNVSVSIPTLAYPYKAFGRVIIANGLTVVFRAAWEYFAYYVLDTVNGTMKFYTVGSNQWFSGLTFSRNLRAYVRTLS